MIENYESILIRDRDVIFAEATVGYAPFTNLGNGRGPLLNNLFFSTNFLVNFILPGFERLKDTVYSIGELVISFSIF